MSPTAIRDLAAIDWTAPWLAPWRSRGDEMARSVLAGMEQPDALNEAGIAPVFFVPQSELPAGMAYEKYIFDRGRVPTRDGLHDFFNGLVWHSFPLAKKRLNELQATQIARTGIQPERGPARDGLTVFDENAALLQAPDELWNALAAKDWQRLFVDLRPLWREAHLVLFGHALMEKLVFARKSMTAHVYRVSCTSHSTADIDCWLAHDLNADKLASKPFAHLPVLGVPGWWAGNDEPAFYDDVTVFRPSKASSESPNQSLIECP